MSLKLYESHKHTFDTNISNALEKYGVCLIKKAPQIIEIVTSVNSSIVSLFNNFFILENSSFPSVLFLLFSLLLLPLFVFESSANSTCDSNLSTYVFMLIAIAYKTYHVLYCQSAIYSTYNNTLGKGSLKKI